MDRSTGRRDSSAVGPAEDGSDLRVLWTDLMDTEEHWGDQDSLPDSSEECDASPPDVGGDKYKIEVRDRLARVMRTF